MFPLLEEGTCLHSWKKKTGDKQGPFFFFFSIGQRTLSPALFNLIKSLNPLNFTAFLGKNLRWWESQVHEEIKMVSRGSYILDVWRNYMAQISQFLKYKIGCPCAIVNIGHAFGRSLIKKKLMTFKKQTRQFWYITMFLFLWRCVTYGHVTVQVSIWGIKYYKSFSCILCNGEYLVPAM